MKKTRTITAAVLAAIMMLSLTGCGGTAPAEDSGGSPSGSSSETVLPAGAAAVRRLVKSVSVVSENDVIDEMRYDMPGTSESLYEYDEAGYLVTKTITYSWAVEVDTYEYDDAGNEVWMRSRLDDNEGTDCFNTYTYNADGQKLSEVYAMGDREDSMRTETVYTYSADLPAAAKKLPATKIFYDGLADEDGVVLDTTEYVYDENYCLIKEVCTALDGSVMTTTYENDENGNPVAIHITRDGGANPGTSEITIVYTYDDAGYRLSETHTDAAGNILKTVTNTYEDVTVG